MRFVWGNVIPFHHTKLKYFIYRGISRRILLCMCITFLVFGLLRKIASLPYAALKNITISLITIDNN